jgi:hypothetical protein
MSKKKKKEIGSITNDNLHIQKNITQEPKTYKSTQISELKATGRGRKNHQRLTRITKNNWNQEMRKKSN